MQRSSKSGEESYQFISLGSHEYKIVILGSLCEL